MKKTVLRASARLIAEVGARVQKGQDGVIEAELDQPEFVTMVADACYHVGARKVTVTWKHQALEKLAIRLVPDSKSAETASELTSVCSPRPRWRSAAAAPLPVKWRSAPCVR